MPSTTPRHPSTTLRRANLSRVLSLLHERGALSRADLTAATGLNRSTIRDLVEGLVGAGLVAESPGEPAGRSGRPSPVVSVDPAVTALAVNPEVDAVTIALVGLDRVVRRRERIVQRAPASPAQTAALAADRLRAWAPTVRPVGVGLAVPGLVDPAAGVVHDASHLGWLGVPLAELVMTATGLPAVVGNDANLGLVAEHRFGAARGVDDAVYLNGGASGIGGAMVIGGRVAPGARGYAGEFGRTAVDLSRPGRALEDEVNRELLFAAIGEGELDETRLSVAVRTPPSPAVANEVARQRRLLATAIANAVTVLNPSVVVLGGFLASLADNDMAGLLRDVRAAAALPEPAADLGLRTASLGEDRLLVGAAEVAFAVLLDDPLRS